MATISTTDPSTGATLESFESFPAFRLEATLERARTAFHDWRSSSFDERATKLRAAAEILRGRKTELADIVTREMGKPIVEAEAEVDKCAKACDFYAEHAPGFLADETVRSNATESYVAYRPLGPVLAVMPWNYPFWQVFRFAAPALMAGNVGVLKHASNVTRSSLEIERVLREAGFPEGTFASVIVPGKEVEKMIDDPRIVAVTLTGSEQTGISVAGAAGRNLKKTVLELGGSDAFIVLADADLDAAAKMAVKSRFQNSGQSCIAAKRFIVEDAVYEAFSERFIAETKKLVIGDPRERTTTMGPMARHDLRETLAGLIEETVTHGGRLALGGHEAKRDGFYFEPTVVLDVTPGMPMFDEETFGPAAALIRAKNADDAVRLANDSRYGLGGNLWTRDLDRAKAIAARLESGGVFINGMTASDPRLPFGGVKHSGYGRELSWLGIREFTNIQTVWIGPNQDSGASVAAE
jgi:acyl-CoA reductase-like NAD-dependent aldehyde dehydrogenase